MRRRLLIAAIFLLAGAVVNVPVAWGCARGTLSISSKDSVALSFQDIAWWNKHVSPLFHGHAESAYKKRGVGIEASIVVSAATTQGYLSATRVASGWPARSLSGEFWDSHGLGKLPPWSERRAAYVYVNRSFVIPFRPFWPGVAVNTLLYAVLLWLLAWGLLAPRRFIRVKRGLCPSCAYPRGESDVCSECGRALSGRARATT